MEYVYENEAIMKTFATVLMSLLLGTVAGYIVIVWENSSRKSHWSKTLSHLTSLWSQQKDSLSARIVDGIYPDNIREHLRFLSAEPHVAGTPRDQQLAVYIRDLWLQQGLDSAELVPYDVLLSYPNPQKRNKVCIVRPDGSTVHECVHFEQLKERHPNLVEGYNAYSPPGNVVGPPVFVNYGRVEDFDLLSEVGIDLSGKICIAKYGKIARGNKVAHAQDRRAIGMLLYLDPSEVARDGPHVYPETWWMPGDAIQRGNIRKDKGDPLTPGYPAVDGVYRYKIEDADLPRIPCQPIGYRDAEIILRSLGGATLPEAWQGEGFTHIGRGFHSENADSQLQVLVNNEYKMTKVYNVIGTIAGGEEPDRYVLYGNHRDAWGYGAVDPSSGTAQMLELTRQLGSLHTEGWKPRRTLVICSWAAEEFGLIGSTEWVEENLNKLMTRAVVYINVDLCVMGDVFQAESSPMLSEAIIEATKQVPAPDVEGKSLYDVWKDYYCRISGRDVEPELLIPGSGTDHDPFYFYAGITAMNMWWGIDKVKHPISMYPAYHTAYDTIEQVEMFLDPTYSRHQACCRLSGVLLHMFADSLVIPYSVEAFAHRLKDSLKQLAECGITEKLNNYNISLDTVEKAVSEFVAATGKWSEILRRMDRKNPIELRRVNDQMMLLERIFVKSEGLPGRPSSRHIAFSPSQHDSYSRGRFPAISDLLYGIDKLQEDDLKTRMNLLQKHISDIVLTVRAATSFLSDTASFQRGWS